VSDRGAEEPAARLCLNWTNPVIRKLAATPAGRVFDLSVQLLYVQSLLAGHHPLGPRDRTMMSTALSELVDRAIDTDIPPATEGAS
jgi:molecular chaperone HtpG